MNKVIVGSLLILTAGVLLATEKVPDPHAAVKAARVEFEKRNGAIFKDARMVAGEALPDAERLDSPTATGTWSAMLPYSDDGRVRFLEVELKDGKFASGTLMTFGDKAPVRIDAKRFEALREGFPLIAVKRDAALYPAKKVGTSAHRNRGTGFGGNVFEQVLGPFGSAALSRFGLQSRGLAYRVSFVGPDGLETDFGVRRSADFGFSDCALKKQEIIQKLTETLEAAYPERKGRISERMLVDYWESGKLAWRGVAE